MRNILMILMITILSIYRIIVQESEDKKEHVLECVNAILYYSREEEPAIAEVKYEYVMANLSEVSEIPKIKECKIQKESIEDKIKAKLNKIESIADNKERFLSYKKLYQKYEEYLDLPENVYDKFSQEEIYLMQRCIETECFGADFDSKSHIASVILNRLEDGRFGDTITDIITTPNQFAYGRKKISDDTILALEYVSMFGDTAEGALYFHSNKKTSTFNGASFVFQDEVGHNFYK